jgi:hypothetical protein
MDVRFAEVCPAQGHPGKVRLNGRICCPPLIPDSDPLLQSCEMLLVRHRSGLLCQPPCHGLLHKEAGVFPAGSGPTL